MMADNIEHVISYWVIFEKFQSPSLAGFAVIAHSVPFLMFSIWAGALADKNDPRRVIQWGMYLFMLASLLWGLLFISDTLEIWHAVIFGKFNCFEVLSSDLCKSLMSNNF